MLANAVSLMVVLVPPEAHESRVIPEVPFGILALTWPVYVKSLADIEAIQTLVGLTAGRPLIKAIPVEEPLFVNTIVMSKNNRDPT